MNLFGQLISELASKHGATLIKVTIPSLVAGGVGIYAVNAWSEKNAMEYGYDRHIKINGISASITRDRSNLPDIEME